MVKRKTQATRMARKLKELRGEMRKRWHVKVPEQHAWLSQVLRGHYAYYGLIFNARSLNQFYEVVRRMWFNALKRRSHAQKKAIMPASVFANITLPSCLAPSPA